MSTVESPTEIDTLEPPASETNADSEGQGNEEIREFIERDYQYGFVSDLDQEILPKGLNEDVVRFISAKKDEPEWLLEWRLNAFRHFMTMTEPHWQNVSFPKIDYQDISYWAGPKKKGPAPKSLDEIDPKTREMFDKLGISLAEQERLSGVAVDAIVDSVSVATTFKTKLAEAGVVFCSFRRRSVRIPNWFVSISGQLSLPGTTSSQRSTRLCSPTVRSCSFPKVFAARWNSRPISG